MKQAAARRTRLTRAVAGLGATGLALLAFAGVLPGDEPPAADPLPIRRVAVDAGRLPLELRAAGQMITVSREKFEAMVRKAGESRAISPRPSAARESCGSGDR